MCARILAGSVLLSWRAVAGDTVTDNLTVNRTSTNWGRLALTQGAGSAPTNGLILYYSFDTNTTPVPDDSGCGNTGTVSGATWVTNGISDGAYSFDGSNDKIEFVPASSPWVTNRLTVSLWARVNSIGTNRILFSISEVTDNSDAKYWIESGCWSDNDFRFGIQTVNTGADSGTTPVSGRWYHVVGTYNGTNLQVYVNGVLSGTTSTSYSQDKTAIVRVGWDSSQSYYNGLLDEIRVYNRVLSASEIRGLYYNEVTPPQSRCRLESGVSYLAPYGDLSQGSYTNRP